MFTKPKFKLMNRNRAFIAVCLITIMMSCSKKTTPAAADPVENAAVVKSSDSAMVVKKAVVKPKPKPMATTPKVILVSDAGAKKSVDGRLYYDMQGKRYWRSNKDGKYYLYNKSMQSDPAFKAPSKKA